jgi:hypothetical protein
MPDRDVSVLEEFEADTKESKARFAAMTFVIFQQMMIAAMDMKRRHRPRLP